MIYNLASLFRVIVFSFFDLIMERLPEDLCLKIFCFLDHKSLATSHQVCRKWKALASDNTVWCYIFKERWGGERTAFYAPVGSKTWKEVYEVQNRCDRVGLGVKIIREAGAYQLVNQGEIQRCLGSGRGRQRKRVNSSSIWKEELISEECCRGILDKIIFFMEELDAASAEAKRGRVL